MNAIFLLAASRRALFEIAHFKHLKTHAPVGMGHNFRSHSVTNGSPRSSSVSVASRTPSTLTSSIAKHPPTASTQKIGSSRCCVRLTFTTADSNIISVDFFRLTGDAGVSASLPEMISARGPASMACSSVSLSLQVHRQRPYKATYNMPQNEKTVSLTPRALVATQTPNTALLQTSNVP